MNKLFQKMSIVVLLSAAILSGCSKDDEKEIMVNTASFFKISVSTETFGDIDLNTRAVSDQADTLITALDDGLYMETVVTHLVSETSSTRSGTESAKVDTGTRLTVMIYKDSGEYAGSILGEVKENGAVQLTSSEELLLSPGSYKFVCVANGSIEGNNTFKTQAGSKSMTSIVEKTINPEDKFCRLSFNMKHRFSQLQVVLNNSITGASFSGLSARLEAVNYPTGEKLLLPGATHDSYLAGEDLIENLFSNESGNILTSKTPKYYIGGGFDMSTIGKVKLRFTSGQVGWANMDGKEIVINNLTLYDNTIIKVSITLKAGYTANFEAEDERGTVSIPTVIGTENTPFQVTAKRGYGYTFVNWVRKSNGAIVSTEDVLTGKLTKKNETYTAKFRPRIFADLDFEFAPGNLTYINGQNQFSTDPRGGDPSNKDECYQFNRTIPGVNAYWTWNNSNGQSYYGDPCKMVADGQWRTPSQNKIKEANECGWKRVEKGLMFNINDTVSGNHLFLTDHIFYMDDWPTTKTFAWRTSRSVSSLYTAPYWLTDVDYWGLYIWGGIGGATSGGDGNTGCDWRPSAWGTYNIPVAIPVRCIRDKN